MVDAVLQVRLCHVMTYSLKTGVMRVSIFSSIRLELLSEALPEVRVCFDTVVYADLVRIVNPLRDRGLDFSATTDEALVQNDLPPSEVHLVSLTNRLFRVHQLLGFLVVCL